MEKNCQNRDKFGYKLIENDVMFMYLLCISKTLIICKENIWNWSVGRERILSSFTGRKKQTAWNNIREKYMPEERRQNLAETKRGSYYWVEEFLDDEGAFYNGGKSGNSNNDDENYNENMQVVVHRCSLR